MLLFDTHLYMHACPQTYTHIHTVEKLKLGTSQTTISSKTENLSHLPTSLPHHPPVTLTPPPTPPNRQNEIRKIELESLTKTEVIKKIRYLGIIYMLAEESAEDLVNSQVIHMNLDVTR